MVVEAPSEDDSSSHDNRRSLTLNVSLTLNDDDVDDDDDDGVHNYHERSPLLGSDGFRRRGRTLSRSSCGRPRAESATRKKPSSLWSLSREQKITLAMTSYTDLLAYLSVSIMAPFFPEEALQKDVSSTLSGWIFGVSAFTQFLISPVIGKLLPYAGVNFVYVAGVFIFSSSTVLFGFLSYVPTEDGNGAFIALAFAIQVFKSVGITACTTSAFVMCAQAFPDNIATALASGEIFVGLGLVTGPAVGGVLYGMDGFYLPFVSIGGLGLLTLPFIVCVLPHQKAFEDSGDDRLSVAQVFCSPVGVLTSITIVVSTCMWSVLDPTLEPHLRQYHLSPELIGLIFLVMAATYALTSPLWGWISDKLEEQRGLLILGFAFATVGSLLIGPSTLLGFDQSFSELWLVIVSLVILGASSSLASIPTFDLYFKIAEKKGCEDDTRTYSMIAGLWLSMYSLGDFIGPTVGGALLDIVGFEMMCTYSAGLCLIMVCLLSLSLLADSSCCKATDPTAVLRDMSVNDVYESFNNSECYKTEGYSNVTDYTAN